MAKRIGGNKASAQKGSNRSIKRGSKKNRQKANRATKTQETTAKQKTSAANIDFNGDTSNVDWANVDWSSLAAQKKAASQQQLVAATTNVAKDELKDTAETNQTKATKKTTKTSKRNKKAIPPSERKIASLGITRASYQALIEQEDYPEPNFGQRNNGMEYHPSIAKLRQNELKAMSLFSDARVTTEHHETIGMYSAKRFEAMMQKWFDEVPAEHRPFIRFEVAKDWSTDDVNGVDARVYISETEFVPIQVKSSDDGVNKNDQKYQGNNAINVSNKKLSKLKEAVKKVLKNPSVVLDASCIKGCTTAKEIRTALRRELRKLRRAS